MDKFNKTSFNIIENIFMSNDKDKNIGMFLSKINECFNLSKSFLIQFDSQVENSKINYFKEITPDTDANSIKNLSILFQTDSSYLEYFEDYFLQKNFLNSYYKNLDLSPKELFENLVFKSISIFPMFKKNNKLSGLLVLCNNNEEKFSIEEMEQINSLVPFLSLSEALKDKIDALTLTSNVFNNTDNGIIITDAEFNILKVNKKFQTKTGFFSFDIEGKNVSIFDDEKVLSSFSFDGAWNDLGFDNSFAGEIWNQDDKGNVIPLWFDIRPIYNTSKEIVNYIGTLSKVNKNSESDSELFNEKDDTTGAMTIDAITSSIKSLIENPISNDESFAVISINIGRIHNLKQRFGVQEEDNILKKISKKLSNYISKNELIARIDNHQFMVVLNSSNKNFSDRAKQISDIIQEPLNIGDSIVYLTSNIGISLYPDNATMSETLIDYSKETLYFAIDKGKNNIEFYTSELSNDNWKKVFIETEIRKALANNDFKLFYQPFYDLKSKNIQGVEALLRWEHEPNKFIPPNDFIPIAEDLGLMETLGEVILQKSFSFIKNNKSFFHDDFKVSINLSARQLSGKDFIKKLKKLLVTYDINTKYVEFELNETFLNINNENAKALLESIKDLGITLALDNFCTGQASLSYIKEYPFEIIKIDREFISKIDSDRVNKSIVKSVIQLANDLNIDVIAEGIETDSHRTILNKINCPYGQGYLFCKPLPENELMKML